MLATHSQPSTNSTTCMKLTPRLALIILFLVLLVGKAWPAATQLPLAEQCFSATSATSGGPTGTGTGFVGLLGTITPGAGGTAGTYGGISLTGGTGTGAVANITVAGGGVTAVTILNPGTGYSVADVLSAAAGSIGNTAGFSVPVSSVSINNALAGGSVSYYYPGTNTPKQTWFNSDAAVIHQNPFPVPLDANGCAFVYGTGTYRQVVKDSLGNTIWDQPTTDPSSNNNVFWAGTAGGTPNTITVTDPGFNATDGSVIQFIVLSTNTGPATLNPSSFGAITILKESGTGPVALAAGDLVAGNVANVVYLASTASFQLLNPAATTAAAAAAAVVTPQGYLTLSNDPNSPVLTADSLSATAVYYTPMVGNQVPIYNGSSFVNFSFAQLTISLTGSQLGNTIYDVCIFSNNGAAAAAITPAWTSSAAGSSARGSGAGTPQLQKINGLYVNAVQITGTNGANSYTIPVNQCTYVGSILIDSVAGQISCYRSYGQARKWGVWNAYNRLPIILKVGDNTANWTYATNTWRVSNGNALNFLYTFTGLAEDTQDLAFDQLVNLAQLGSSTNNVSIGIGLNATTPSGYSPKLGFIITVASGVTMEMGVRAHYVLVPSLGLNTVNALENGLGSNGTAPQFVGTEANMLLTAQYGG
jgi:hypothetical protein